MRDVAAIIVLIVILRPFFSQIASKRPSEARSRAIAVGENDIRWRPLQFIDWLRYAETQLGRLAR
jgi:hypothetical protein